MVSFHQNQPQGVLGLVSVLASGLPSQSVLGTVYSLASLSKPDPVLS